MNITLKNIKHMPSLSEETECYSADLYLDGKLVAHVSNRGHGGCDEQRPAKGQSYDIIRTMNDWCKANLPKHSYDFGEGRKGEYDTDLEGLCNELLNKHLNAAIEAKNAVIRQKQQEQLAKFKSEFSSKIIFLKTPKGRGIVSIPYDATNVARARLYVKTKFPKAIILNDCSEEKLTQLLCG